MVSLEPRYGPVTISPSIVDQNRRCTVACRPVQRTPLRVSPSRISARVSGPSSSIRTRSFRALAACSGVIPSCDIRRCAWEPRIGATRSRIHG
jgi:hypothetical protein